MKTVVGRISTFSV